MGIARQIGQRGLRAAEGAFAVDHPFDPARWRQVRYRASGLVHWRIPEMPHSASDGRLRFPSGRWKAVQAHVHEFTP